MCSLASVNNDGVVCRHVFLGFSRDGLFILSYTMQVEVDSAMSAGNSYRLQCWLFTPYRPLRLVLHRSCRVVTSRCHVTSCHVVLVVINSARRYCNHTSLFVGLFIMLVVTQMFSITEEGLKFERSSSKFEAGTAVMKIFKL